MTTTSSIEQLLRAEMVTQHVGNNDIDRLVRHMKQYEDENVWAPEVVTDDKNAWDPEVVTDESDASIETPDPWLRNKLKEVRQTEAQLRRERRDWYDSVCGSIISTRTHMSNSDFKATIADHFDTRIIHDDEQARDAAEKLRAGKYLNENYYTHIDDCDGVDIRDCGFDFPIPLIVCNSLSGDTYPFVPWCGVATCTCQMKHKTPNTKSYNGPAKTLCKHELRALNGLEGVWPPGDITLPTQYTRLFTPQAYNRWQKAFSQDR